MAGQVLLRMAWRNVRRNLRHSAGSVLAIAVGFFALAVSSGYLGHLFGEHTDRMLERFMMGHVIVEPTRATEIALGATGADLPTLGAAEQAFVDEWLAARAPEIEARARMRYVWGLASTGKSSMQFVGLGYDVDDGAKLRRRFAWDALAGKPLQHAGPGSVVLARGLAGLLDCEPTSTLPALDPEGLPIAAERPFACRRPRVQLVANTASGQLNVVEPEVAGIIDGGLKEFDVKYLAMPIAVAQRLVDDDGVSLYALALRDPSRAAAFAGELTGAARARGLDVRGVLWADHHSAVENRRASEMLRAYRVLVGVVVVLIAGLSVLTTMAKAVSERTREIGTLRSLGFLRRHVVALFAMEAALLAAIASAIGLAATLAATAALNASGITYDAGVAAQPLPLRVALMPGTWAAAGLFLAAVGALAAVVPARRAAKGRIPDALTHV